MGRILAWARRAIVGGLAFLLVYNVSALVAHGQGYNFPPGLPLLFQLSGALQAPTPSTINFGSGLGGTLSGGTLTVTATGSGGTVTSISQGAGITLTPNPITGTGSVALTVPVGPTNGGTGLTSVGSAGRVFYANDGTSPAYSDVITVRGDLTPGTSGTVDTTIITFPSGLGTNTNGILVSDLTVRLRQAIVSSDHTGQTVVTVGTSAGGTQYLLSQTITDATGAGTVYGLDTTTVGSAFTSANLYNAVAAGASSVIVRTVTTGTVGTPALLTIHFNAEVL